MLCHHHLHRGDLTGLALVRTSYLACKITKGQLLQLLLNRIFLGTLTALEEKPPWQMSHAVKVFLAVLDMERRAQYSNCSMIDKLKISPMPDNKRSLVKKWQEMRCSGRWILSQRVTRRLHSLRSWSSITTPALPTSYPTLVWGKTSADCGSSKATMTTGLILLSCIKCLGCVSWPTRCHKITVTLFSSLLEDSKVTLTWIHFLIVCKQ